jgi:hypothetical protein
MPLPRNVSAVSSNTASARAARAVCYANGEQGSRAGRRSMPPSRRGCTRPRRRWIRIVIGRQQFRVLHSSCSSVWRSQGRSDAFARIPWRLFFVRLPSFTPSTPGANHRARHKVARDFLCKAPVPVGWTSRDWDLVTQWYGITVGRSLHRSTKRSRCSRTNDRIVSVAWPACCASHAACPGAA